MLVRGTEPASECSPMSTASSDISRLYDAAAVPLASVRLPAPPLLLPLLLPMAIAVDDDDAGDGDTTGGGLYSGSLPSSSPYSMSIASAYGLSCARFHSMFSVYCFSHADCSTAARSLCAI